MYRGGEEFGWFPAKVMNKKDEYYFVHYSGYEDRVNDEIVFERSLRPVNMRDGPEIESVRRSEKRVDEDLIEWIDSADATRQVVELRDRSGAFSVGTRKVGKDTLFIALGSQKAVTKAEKLFDILSAIQKEIMSYE